VEPAFGMSTDALEDIAQMGERGDAEPLAGLQVATKLLRTAAVRPPLSLPKNIQFLRPTARAGRPALHNRGPTR